MAELVLRYSARHGASEHAGQRSCVSGARREGSGHSSQRMTDHRLSSTTWLSRSRHRRSLPEFLQAHREGSADVFIGRWNADESDPDSFASIFHSRTGFIGRVCSSPDLDMLIERARTESIPSVRHRMYREFEELLDRDGIIVPLFHEQAYRIARPEIEGLTSASARRWCRWRTCESFRRARTARARPWRDAERRAGVVGCRAEPRRGASTPRNDNSRASGSARSRGDSAQGRPEHRRRATARSKLSSPRNRKRVRRKSSSVTRRVCSLRIT